MLSNVEFSVVFVTMLGAAGGFQCFVVLGNMDIQVSQNDVTLHGISEIQLC